MKAYQRINPYPSIRNRHRLEGDWEMMKLENIPIGIHWELLRLGSMPMDINWELMRLGNIPIDMNWELMRLRNMPIDIVISAVRRQSDLEALKLFAQNYLATEPTCRGEACCQVQHILLLF